MCESFFAHRVRYGILLLLLLLLFLIRDRSFLVFHMISRHTIVIHILLTTFSTALSMKLSFSMQNLCFFLSIKKFPDKMIF